MRRYHRQKVMIIKAIFIFNLKIEDREKLK